MRAAPALLLCASLAGQVPVLTDNLQAGLLPRLRRDPFVALAFGSGPQPEGKGGKASGATVTVWELAMPAAQSRALSFQAELRGGLLRAFKIPPPSLHRIEFSDFMATAPDHPETFTLNLAMDLARQTGGGPPTQLP